MSEFKQQYGDKFLQNAQLTKPLGILHSELYYYKKTTYQEQKQTSFSTICGNTKDYNTSKYRENY